MKFIRDDGGRAAAGFRGNAGDCVTRAVAIATGKPYAEVYAALSHGMATQRVTKRRTRKSSARNGVSTRSKWFRDYMTSLGWKWTPTMQIGSGCKVHLTDGELPIGRLVVAVSKHYVAVIDGVVHDTHDPQRETTEIFTIPASESPRPDWRLLNDHGTHRQYAGPVQRRCVYGYWSQP